MSCRLARFPAERGDLIIELDRPNRAARRARRVRSAGRSAAREALSRAQLAQPRATGDGTDGGMRRSSNERQRLANESQRCTFRGVESGERQARIVRGLQDTGRVEVAELAERFATSEVTVRRDLDELAEAGVLRRVRGGAVSLLMRGQELPFAMRELEAAQAKARIAETTVGLLRDGEAVVLDSGTTTLEVARRLGGRRLTVLTLSLHAVGPLSASASITLMVPGGTARYGELSLTGPMTLADIAALRFDTAVISCCGLSLRAGVTTHDLGDAAVKRAAMAAAARTVLVADSQKFSRSALAVVCPATGVDVLVTDPDAPPGPVAALREAGVEVHGG